MNMNQLKSKLNANVTVAAADAADPLVDVISSEINPPKVPFYKKPAVVKTAKILTGVAVVGGVVAAGYYLLASGAAADIVDTVSVE